jgi:type IV pilus assembly protein PilM
VLKQRLQSLLADPPPEMAFEISEAGLAAAGTGTRTEVVFHPFKPGAVSPSPIKENILDEDAFVQGVRALAASAAGRKRKDVALILPDNSARVVVLDFDAFPSDAKEQAPLVRFRLKRSVPFDVESAALSYWAQPSTGKRREVVVAVAPLEIVSRYEAPFRAAGLTPGLAVPSSLAALELLPVEGLVASAKLAGHTLSVTVVGGGALKLVRCVELASGGLDDIFAVLIPTFAYVEDNMGRRPEILVTCGFGESGPEAATRIREELGAEAEELQSPWGAPSASNAGLLGYLRSVRNPARVTGGTH